MSIEEIRAQNAKERRACVEWATEAVYLYIVDSYASYRAGRLAREPRLTVTFLRDYFEQATAPDWFRCEGKKGQRAIIQAAVDRLVRQKRIISSLTVGERGNNETRAYEPAT